jgi:enamine deaminase RidA (YjgF/YER057c/UK114 family)
VQCIALKRATPHAYPKRASGGLHMDQKGKRPVNPPSLFNSSALGFSQAVRSGDTVYCSGQVSFADGLEAQAREAFTNVRTLLAYAGANMADIVKVTMYSTEVDCWARTEEIRREFLKPPFPAITMVVVKALAGPKLMIEIDVTAVIGAGVG